MTCVHRCRNLCYDPRIISGRWILRHFHSAEDYCSVVLAGLNPSGTYRKWPSHQPMAQPSCTPQRTTVTPRRSVAVLYPAAGRSQCAQWASPPSQRFKFERQLLCSEAVNPGLGLLDLTFVCAWCWVLVVLTYVSPHNKFILCRCVSAAIKAAKLNLPANQTNCTWELSSKCNRPN